MLSLLASSTLGSFLGGGAPANAVTPPRVARSRPFAMAAVDTQTKRARAFLDDDNPEGASTASPSDRAARWASPKPTVVHGTVGASKLKPTDRVIGRRSVSPPRLTASPSARSLLGQQAARDPQGL